MKCSLKTIAILFSFFFAACEKKVHLDGTVLSQHGVPCPDAQISVFIGHGESSYGGGNVGAVTDEEGNFTVNQTICNSCWVSIIEASVKDSGFVEFQTNNASFGLSKRSGESSVELRLKQ